MRPSRELPAGVAEPCPRLDEVAAKLDVETGLLERLPHGPGDEVLAGLDPAAGRAPHACGEVRLADWDGTADCDFATSSAVFHASRINYDSVEFNKTIPDSIFAKPATAKEAKKDLKL